MLIVVARAPAAPLALMQAARIAGLAPADIHNRLAGALPRVLCAEADPDRAAALVAALEAEGFVALACDPAAVPGDDERLVAHALELSPDGLVASAGGGHKESCPADAIALVQRGVRSTTETTVTTTSHRQIAPARALLSGGLLLTKKVEKTHAASRSRAETFLLLHRRDGGTDIVLYEQRLDYRCLGDELAPTSLVNFERLQARLRAMAPAAPFDDRTGRPGFAAGMRFHSGDKVDLALHLVWLMHLRGVA